MRLALGLQARQKIDGAWRKNVMAAAQTRSGGSCNNVVQLTLLLSRCRILLRLAGWLASPLSITAGYFSNETAINASKKVFEGSCWLSACVANLS